IHSDAVLSLTAPPASAAEGKPRADGMVTATPGIGLGILTADCQPVLFADAAAGVIGAAHAGWRGALGGVLERVIDKMVGLGAARDRITAVIGPTISQSAYEVGPEFLDTFMAEDQGYSRFFAQGKEDRLLFDLPAFGLHRLRSAGIARASWTHHCT
ncbi:polyphenol oxidase, partial [Thioclava sp. BHET1]